MSRRRLVVLRSCLGGLMLLLLAGLVQWVFPGQVEAACQHVDAIVGQPPGCK